MKWFIAFGLAGNFEAPAEKLTSMAIKFFEGTYQSLINEEANHLLKTAEKASPSKACIYYSINFRGPTIEMII